MANNAVTAKARAVYGKFLTKDDYISLLHKGSISAAVAYLKTKPLYEAIFADTAEMTIHREQAEQLINQNVFDNYLRLCRYAAGDKKGIMSFQVKQTECEQLAKAVIAVSSGSQEGYLRSFPEYMSEHLCFDPLRLAAAKKLPDIADAIKGTMYSRPLEPLLNDPSPDINRIVTMINVCYIKWAFEQTDKTEKGRTRELLKEFILHKTDADNLLMCYRMKKTFSADSAGISELLIPYHRRLRVKDIQDALKMPDPVSALKELFVKVRAAAPEDLAIPEVGVNIADYRYFRHRLAVSTGETESLYSLMMLLRAESVNLCRIIEGLRYGLPPEETEKYLII